MSEKEKSSRDVSCHFKLFQTTSLAYTSKDNSTNRTEGQQPCESKNLHLIISQMGKITKRFISNQNHKSRVADPFHFDVDPDPLILI